MRKVVNKNLMIFSLILVLCISLFFGYKTLNNKKDVSEKYKTNNERKQFAMFIKNNENNQYETYDGDSFPEGYKANLDRSLCTDINGNIVKDVISNSENGITVTSNKTVYCEIYLDEKGILASDFVEDSSIGLYNTTLDLDALRLRYQGTDNIVTSNYICFGTSSKSTCINSSNVYMYRIIGVSKDEKLKIIKETSLNEKSPWHRTQLDDVKWPESDLYKRLNGISSGEYNNIFIDNTVYVSNNWSQKIDVTNWKYGLISSDEVNETIENLVLLESKWETTINAKIGLMYLSDYFLSPNKEGEICANENLVCRQSWLNRDKNNITGFEATMTYVGYSDISNVYRFWIIYNSGSIHAAGIANSSYIRPVFYLRPNIEIKGTGTIDDPYIIVN